jgi:hypothetical protein
MAFTTPFAHETELITTTWFRTPTLPSARLKPIKDTAIILQLSAISRQLGIRIYRIQHRRAANSGF